MFVSFRNKEEAIAQANFDHAYILSMKNANRIGSGGANTLTINSNVGNITGNYKIYLDTVLELVGANEWQCCESKDKVKSIIFYWYDSLKKAA